MNLIATVDKNWAIGKQGHLLVNIPEDIKLFRMETAGKAAIVNVCCAEAVARHVAAHAATIINLADLVKELFTWRM